MARHARKTNPGLRLGLGFSLAMGLLTVSAVSPSLEQLSIADNSAPDTPGQVLVVENAVFNFERGDYEIMTGPEATSVLVEFAPVPEDDSVKGYALGKVEQSGWDYPQYSCLVKLWERESNWRTTALNSSPGAYGIPQSLPAERMASAGSDWRTNPETQIDWGINYIDRRYGSPCAALAHSDIHNWY